MRVSKREIAKSVKTLIVLLQSLKKQQVTITLRNDTTVRGTIVKVDDCMNIELENAIVEDDLFYKTDKKQTLNLNNVNNNDCKELEQQQQENDYMNIDVECDSNINNGELEQEDDGDMSINSDDQDTIDRQKQELMAGNSCSGWRRINNSLEENLNIEHDDQDNNVVGDKAGDDYYDDEQQCSSDSDDDVCTNDSIGGENNEGDYSDSSNGGMHDYFLVKGSRVRHIDLPSDCDLVACAKSEIERIRHRNRPWSKKDIVQTTTVMEQN